MSRKEKRIKRKKRTIINFFLIVLIASIFIWIISEHNQETNLKEPAIEKLVSSNVEKTNDEKEEKTDLPNKYKGYSVMARLEIPSIKLETYVLKEYSETSLNISVTKFWGADANQIGNFCIAGHNFFKKDNMFHNLKKVKINDEIYITDSKIGKINYEVYQKEIVAPEDVSCLSQDTKGKRETTLITCTNNSEKRIIVKAKQKEEEV